MSKNIHEVIIMADDDSYPDIEDTNFDFTASQWKSVANAGHAASIISFIANSCVLVVHGFMSWHRPAVVNRLSLRMIVFSCVCNMLYCASQLVTDNISAQSASCLALAYVTVVSDTMACMCLAMVGLNLVMIFVLKVPRSLKIEIVYYLVVLLFGVIVSVIPHTVGNSDGLRNDNSEVTCWYYYYFDGRMVHIFNWMWYYGCLLFSLLFAAICAAISIRFVVKKQQNYTSALNMRPRRNQKDVESVVVLRKYMDKNIDVFQRIALRCICYPLVPLFSKSWGVGIEIAASQHKSIPYAVFVLDRLFSCLLGFMVSCIYFTDPAINAVFKEFVDSVKTIYVYDYYSIRYYSTTAQLAPKLAKMVVRFKDIADTPELLNQARCRYLSQGSADASNNDKHDGHSQEKLTPSIKLTKIHGRQANEVFSDDGPYSVITAITKDGRSLLLDNYLRNDAKSLLYNSKKRYKDIPMRSLGNTSTLAKSKSELIGDEPVGYQNPSNYRKESENIETLQAFDLPLLAKMIHWSLIHLFCVKPHNAGRKELGTRNGNPSHFPKTSLSNENNVSFEQSVLADDLNEIASTSIFSSDFDFNARHNFEEKSIDSLKRTCSAHVDQSPSIHPLRRASVAVTCTQSFWNQEKPPLVQQKPGTASRQPTIQSSIKHNESMSLSQEDHSTPTPCLRPTRPVSNENFSSNESFTSKTSFSKELADVGKITQPDPIVEFPVQLSPRPKSQYAPLQSLEYIKKTQGKKKFLETTAIENSADTSWHSLRASGHVSDINSNSGASRSYNGSFPVQRLYADNTSRRASSGVAHTNSKKHNLLNCQNNQSNIHIVDMFGLHDLKERMIMQKEIADDIEHL
ncbi:hypothetical protein A0J61_08887 [Choanephora cucurbitarum]|uniref:Uncharacterized protein n=1 Tax=Choanephora cucurbitarum TaxID=101091 RepID=A0A1C7N6V6_9FUNG|nr:hypothetical protein A0J61_08887 [Choanephora cucurbitarum]